MILHPWGMQYIGCTMCVTTQCLQYWQGSAAVVRGAQDVRQCCTAVQLGLSSVRGCMGTLKLVWAIAVW
jgi:hypothetical protein